MTCRQLYYLTMLASKRRIRRDKGAGYYKSFVKSSRREFESVLAVAPDIGGSLFSFNYKFGICYAAWYKALLSMSVKRDDAAKEIWNLTESVLHLIPRPIMKLASKPYLNGFRKKAPYFERLGLESKLHPFDFKIRFVNIDDNSFELDFYECGMKKLFERLNIDGLMPAVCRIDYMMFSYMGVGFSRDKTLGDGDDCCNCKYSIVGHCEWAPEKGFVNRK